MIQIKNNKFNSLDDALNSIKDDTKETIIKISNEYFKGQYTINKNNVTLDCINTIFTNNYGGYKIMEDGFKRGTFNTYTLFLNADNIKLKGLIIENTVGYDNVGQGIALMSNSDNLLVEDCIIDGYQDTLFLAPLPLQEFEKGGFKGPLQDSKRLIKNSIFRSCTIKGSVDFIFGGGNALFEDCLIISMNINKTGYICAPSTNKDDIGFVFKNCKFTHEHCKPNTIYLARPWREYGKTKFLNCFFDKHINEEGYYDWNRDITKPTFIEEKCYGPGSKKDKRVSWSKQV